MQPFALYYGGKWRLARRYGEPQHEHVIEPFAGFAGYSTYWQPRKVTLIEKDPVVIGVWRYLQRASRQEIMRIPSEIEDVDDLHVCQEAKWLIGFWLNRGLAVPAKRPSNWARSDRYRYMFWGQRIRARISRQVEKVRSWRIIEGDYTLAPNIEGHWHIDPPYKVAGRHYSCNSDSIDYADLAKWCRQRKGYVQVCETEGADWLPFQPFALTNTTRPRQVSVECLWEKAMPCPQSRAKSTRIGTPRVEPLESLPDLATSLSNI